MIALDCTKPRIPDGGLFVANGDGSNKRQLVALDEVGLGVRGEVAARAWSPDNEFLLYRRDDNRLSH